MATSWEAGRHVEGPLPDSIFQNLMRGAVDKRKGTSAAAPSAAFRRSRKGICGSSPVNLIGEHTDYTGGLVMPVAMGFRTVAVLSPSADNRAVFYSVNLEEVSFEIAPMGRTGQSNRQVSSDRTFGASASRPCRMFKSELLESNLRLKIKGRPSSGLTALQLGDSTSLLDKAAFGCLECDLR